MSRQNQVDHVTVAPTKGARLALSERVSLASTPGDRLTFDRPALSCQWLTTQQYLDKNPYGYCPVHATGVTCN